MTPYPSARSVRHALRVLEAIPLEAQAHLAEAIIERLDAAGPDADLEEETDGCEFEDRIRIGYFGPGDADDAEDSDEDRCVAGDDGGATFVSDGQPGDAEDAEESDFFPGDLGDDNTEDEPRFFGRLRSVELLPF